MSEAIQSFTERHMPTYSRWFSRAQLKKSWANRGLIVKYVFFGWLVPFKWLHDLVFELREWQQFAVAANLPQPLHDLTTKVIKRTRLWNREKNEIAIELVSHFQDGIESGKTAEELKDSFGDAKQAARLMRRAKKRCRPIWWQAWWYVSRGLSITLGCYFVIACAQAIARPDITIDYFKKLNAPIAALNDEERAWPLLRQAFSEIDLVHHPKWADIYFNAASGDITSFSPKYEHWPEVVRWLESKQHAFGLMREASKRKGWGFVLHRHDENYDPRDRRVIPELGASRPETIKDTIVPDPEGIPEAYAILLPHVNSFRLPIDYIFLDAIRAAEAGDSKTAAENVAAIYRIGKQEEELQIAVPGLIACALQKRALQAINIILCDYPKLWSNDQLQEMAHLLAADRVSIHDWFIGERYLHEDFLQRIYTDDGNGDGRITKQGMDYFAKNIAYMKTHHSFLPKFLPVISTGDKAPTELLKILLLPVANHQIASRRAMREKMDSIVEVILDTNRSLQEFEKHQLIQRVSLADANDRELKEFPLAYYLTSGLKNARYNYERHNGLVDGTLIGIALELYYRKHGAWADTLAELSPHLIPRLPVDRVSGRPLRYKMKDGRALVYSVGMDKDDDDGARLPKSCDDNYFEYHFQLPFHEGQGNAQKSIAELEAEAEGDWIIWTTIPEFRKVPELKPSEALLIESEPSDSEQPSRNPPSEKDKGRS